MAHNDVHSLFAVQVYHDPCVMKKMVHCCCIRLDFMFIIPYKVFDGHQLGFTIVMIHLLK